MRNISGFVMLMVLTLIAVPGFAGEGHEHNPDGSHAVGPATSEAVTKKAERHVKKLVSRGKLDESWSDVKSTGATQKTYEQGQEWVVTFKNDKVADPAKQTLFVFYTLNGRYLASNFTGK